jgi:hypothetical protein
LAEGHLADALIEDSLALAQASVGLAPAVRPWSTWVKFLRWVLSGSTVRRQHVPSSTSGRA